MAEHWIYARDLVSVLVAFLYGQDDDGIDLYFTSSSQLVGTFHEPKQFFEEMNKYRPSNGSQQNVSGTQNLAKDTKSGFIAPDSIPRAATASTASSNELSENINDVLYGILRNWSNRFTKKEEEKLTKKEKKKLTLIVLTDGVWAGVDKKGIVANGIVYAVETAQNRGGSLKKELGQRGLSIQFVRFGNDEEAIAELDYMDNSLRGTDGQPLP